jgi:mannosyltransferase OCH1-like enzyme
MYNLLILFVIIIVIILLITYVISKDSFTNKDNSKIPKVIYLTHKTTVPDYVIKNWKRLNPEYEIKYYNDTDIRNFLAKYYPKSYLDYFNKLDSNKGAGPIKADFWRICILYKFGGVYVDTDIEPIEPIRTFLEKDTDLLLCVSDKYKNTTNPHILISKKNDSILKECLNVYEKEKFNLPYSYWFHSITLIMFNILYKYFSIKYIEKNYYIGNYKVQILLEKHLGKTLHETYCVYKNKKVLNNRYQTYDSLRHTF